MNKSVKSLVTDLLLRLFNKSVKIQIPWTVDTNLIKLKIYHENSCLVSNRLRYHLLSLITHSGVFIHTSQCIERLGHGTNSNTHAQRRSLGPKHFTELGLPTTHHTPHTTPTQTFRTLLRHLGG